ncbi:MAG: ABC transporter permease [Candidatus Micrarchaeota archaeon]
MWKIDSIIEFFWYAYRSLLYSKLRSSLTILGIVIGIAAIVSLISLGEGLSYTIDDMMSAFGSNMVVVMPGSLSSMMGGSHAPGASEGRLFEKDINTIAGVPGVELITAYIMSQQSITFRDQTASISVMGVYPDALFAMYKDFYVLREGRFPRDSDRNVALLGANIADDVFDRKISAGQFIYIGKEKKKFRVIGVLEKKGGLEGEDNDNAVVVHIDDMKELSGGSLAKNEVNGIMFEVADGMNVTQVAERAEIALAAAHHVRLEEKDFTIMTSESMLDQIGMITDLISLFLAFIASISLIVGGVGVMNTMYMAVMERTGEIGTLKAIGASDFAVLSIFIIESGMLGLLGGVIGILVGGFFALIVNIAGFHAIIDLSLITFALGFSFTIGMVSGFLPARRAASITPIEALRYE